MSLLPLLDLNRSAHPGPVAAEASLVPSSSAFESDVFKLAFEGADPISSIPRKTPRLGCGGSQAGLSWSIALPMLAESDVSQTAPNHGLTTLKELNAETAVVQSQRPVPEESDPIAGHAAAIEAVETGTVPPTPQLLPFAVPSLPAPVPPALSNGADPINAAAPPAAEGPIPPVAPLQDTLPLTASTDILPEPRAERVSTALGARVTTTDSAESPTAATPPLGRSKATAPLEASTPNTTPDPPRMRPIIEGDKGMASTDMVAPRQHNDPDLRPIPVQHEGSKTVGAALGVAQNTRQVSPPMQLAGSREQPADAKPLQEPGFVQATPSFKTLSEGSAATYDASIRPQAMASGSDIHESGVATAVAATKPEEANRTQADGRGEAPTDALAPGTPMQTTKESGPAMSVTYAAGAPQSALTASQVSASDHVTETAKAVGPDPERFDRSDINFNTARSPHETRTIAPEGGQSSATVLQLEPEAASLRADAPDPVATDPLIPEIRTVRESAGPTATGSANGLSTAAAASAISSQIAQAVTQTRDGFVEVALSPEELGKVRMTLQSHEAGIAVAVQAERPETLDLMRRHIELLERDFRDLGYATISFSFSSDQRNGADRTPTTPEQGGAEPAPRTDTLDTVPLSTPAPRDLIPGGLDLRL